MSMEIEFGTEVTDKNNTVLGKVDYLVRDTWTGELRKFMVRIEKDNLFFSPEDVLEANDSRIKVNYPANGQDSGKQRKSRPAR